MMAEECYTGPTFITPRAVTPVMYPKNFIFDEVAIARARMVTLRKPNLNIMDPETRARMPGIAHFLEGGFKAGNREGKLLLPDLSALKNTTVGIFSDYGGESTGRYSTYTFLVCAYGSLGPFKEKMAALRSASGIGQKEIAFKDFGMGQLRRMLPAYLQLLDQYVSGLVFTLVVDKSIPSLFGPSGPENLREMTAALEVCGYHNVTPKVTEKLFRVLHTIAFLIALLGHPGQKLLWMTDNDPIGETPERHNLLLRVLERVLPLYTKKQFGLMGGIRPFQERAFDFLDLLSVSDIAAGAVAQVLTSIDELGPEGAQIKEGADHVLRWLCYSSIVLKKFCLTVKRNTNGVVSFGTVNFEARRPIEGEVFIPMEMVR